MKERARELKAEARASKKREEWEKDFFQSAQKFKSRYATLGLSDEARLDEGAMWSTALALKELTADEEAEIVALVQEALR